MPTQTDQDILGLLSLLFWMLMIVVSLKYVTIVLRADNRGEGGTLALMELALRGKSGKARWRLIILGLIGACLFYGDSMITPAISVLSAIEGIGIVSHRLDDRSEEHTSELQSLIRISYAVFCLKKKKEI